MMSTLYCVNNTNLVLGIIIIISVTLIIIITAFNTGSKSCPVCPSCPMIDNTVSLSETQPRQQLDNRVTLEQNLIPNVPVTDVIRDYDYRKVFDPLEQPTRRVARHEIQPFYLKQMIDLPSRGYPDNFTQFGVLIKQGDPNKNVDNKIIRLFGRQEFPGSNRYEYYTLINSGNDQIKVPIRNKRRDELYDGDKIYIKELDEHYKVSLHKFDEPKYYPDILY